MLLSQNLLADGERLDEEWLRLRVVPLGLVQRGQIVQAGGVIGMLLSQNLLADGERLDEERLRLRVVPLGLIQTARLFRLRA